MSKIWRKSVEMDNMQESFRKISVASNLVKPVVLNEETKYECRMGKKE